MMAPKLEVLKKLLDDPASGICEPISVHSSHTFAQTGLAHDNDRSHPLAPELQL